MRDRTPKPEGQTVKTQICSLLLGAGLMLPLSSHAALFTFDDFPVVTTWPVPDPDAPQTYLYQCGGKAYCSYLDVFQAAPGLGITSSITTSQEGISATFSRQGALYDVWPPNSADRAMTSGNFGSGWDLFLADFDTDLSFFEVELSAPRVRADFEDWVVLELWSDSGATGALIDSLVVKPSDWSGGSEGIFALGAPQGEAFRSVRFGLARSDHPDCRVDCAFDRETNLLSADDIRVTPTIPEPSAALCFAVGLLLAARRTHWR